jgi:hypothetical protein
MTKRNQPATPIETRKSIEASSAPVSMLQHSSSSSKSLSSCAEHGSETINQIPAPAIVPQDKTLGARTVLMTGIEDSQGSPGHMVLLPSYTVRPYRLGKEQFLEPQRITTKAFETARKSVASGQNQLVIAYNSRTIICDSLAMAEIRKAMKEFTPSWDLVWRSLEEGLQCYLPYKEIPETGDLLIWVVPYRNGDEFSCLEADDLLHHWLRAATETRMTCAEQCAWWSKRLDKPKNKSGLIIFTSSHAQCPAADIPRLKEAFEQDIRGNFELARELNCSWIMKEMGSTIHFIACPAADYLRGLQICDKWNTTYGEEGERFIKSWVNAVLASTELPGPSLLEHWNLHFNKKSEIESESKVEFILPHPPPTSRAGWKRQGYNNQEGPEKRVKL